MERWLRITETGHGEWSVLDLERGYRICAFNHDVHGGVHLHHRKETRLVEIAGLDEAKQVARAYAAKHRAFRHETFEKVVKAWKSEASTG